MQQRTVIASVVGILVVIAVAVAGFFALQPGEQPGEQQSMTATRTSISENAPWTFVPGADQRSDCVAGGVGGIDLPCLGGDAVPGEHKDLVLVNVWAWWCEPCQRELPITQAFADAHPEFDVVGVHADPNSANGVAMMNEFGLNFPSYQDDVNKFAGLLGLPGVVPIVLVYQDGAMRGMFPQAFNSLEELEAAVASVV